MSLVFIDTNILVYSDDGSNLNKQARATEVIAENIRSRNACLSTQVLQEYFVTVTRKLGLDARIAQDKVFTLSSACKIAVITERDVIAAIELHRLNLISFWDALIIRAAVVVQAKTLLSEDLQSGRAIAGLKIVNPFA